MTEQTFPGYVREGEKVKGGEERGSWGTWQGKAQYMEGNLQGLELDWAKAVPALGFLLMAADARCSCGPGVPKT